ncbi:DUF4395 domain-containing protein [Paenibacillus sp. TAB 01]|uniref:DUF4395 domain-containing protein n=1 Tax=Paenibacillus sp. TAB 01 TaxID=3368988 RepID=UPI0037523B18
MTASKEIPIPYVRANQTGIVLFIVLGIILQQPAWIIVLWLIQVAGLSLGARGNLFIRLTAPLLARKAKQSAGEAVELQRFNNSIAVGLLTIAVLCFWIGPASIAGYIFAGMVALAAFIAICGFCVGCFLYFQYKQNFRRR